MIEADRIQPINQGGAIILPQEPVVQENATLASNQQKAIAELALSYLRRNDINFSQENLKGALAVLGIDSIQRGLSLSGKAKVEPGDNVRKLIAEGLEQRSRTQKAVEELNLSQEDELAKTRISHIGPLALPRHTAIACQKEAKTFLLNPNPENSERMVHLAETRRAILPKIADFIITSLPKDQYPQASLARFPEMSDQAKIVRNMIVSLVFRRNPFPIITIDEITQFVNATDAITMFRQEIPAQISSAIYSRLNLPQESVASYMLGLFTQTKEAFLNYATRFNKSETNEDRDVIYRLFESTLLLLHPALEEHLITHPSKLKGMEGEFSLWSPDLSTVIAGFRVPNTYGLRRATRLAEAEKYSTERFDQAVHTWRNLAKNQQAEKARINTLRILIQDAENELRRARDPHVNLPATAEWLMKNFAHTQWESYHNAQANFRRNKKITESASELSERISIYVTSIKNQNGELPEEADLPKWLYEEKEKIETRKPERIKAQAQAAIERAVDEIRADFLTQHIPIFAEQVQGLENFPSGNVRALAQKVQEEMNRVRKDLSSGIFFGEGIGITQVLDHINLKLENYSEVISGSIRNKALELRKLKKLIQKGQKSGFYKSREVPIEFYLYVLKVRKKSLETIFSEKRKIEYVPAVGKIPTTWKRDEIEEWLKRNEVATLPEETSIDFIKNNFDAINKWWVKFTGGRLHIVWPNQILTRPEFIIWIHKTIAEKNSRVEKGPSPNEQSRWLQVKERLEKSIKLLQEFIPILDNPLFPLKEGEGIRTTVFWSAFSERMRYLDAMIRAPLLQKQTTKQEKSYKPKMLEIYKKRLETQKQKYEQELHDLSSDIPPSVQKFISHMKDLDLAIEEPSIQ